MRGSASLRLERAREFLRRRMVEETQKCSKRKERECEATALGKEKEPKKD